VSPASPKFSPLGFISLSCLESHEPENVCFPISEFWIRWLALLNLYDHIMVYLGLRREPASVQPLISTRAIQSFAGLSSLKKALSLEAMFWFCEEHVFFYLKFLFSGTLY
jgi:hypothetical protein